MEDKCSWLDTETQAILEPSPPPKMAPADLPDFALVLLSGGKDSARMVRCVRRINGWDGGQARTLLERPLPLVVNWDLPYHDALLGQFEFVCCDAVAVFISSEVVAQGAPSYLNQLYTRLKQSEEFCEVALTIQDVPKNEEGARFLDQFLGFAPEEVAKRGFPMDIRVLGKKARIMLHWSSKIGADLQVAPAGE
jgi:hypothetical protein